MCRDAAHRASVASDRRAIVSYSISGRYVPAGVPGENLTPDDMARVTPDDWADILNLSRRYCATVDSTRSRKRKDGSATITRGGYAPYGTDDVSDDVTQDAVLLFAARFRDIIGSCAIASQRIGTREATSWLYVRKDAQTVTITRATLHRWAVRDAAARNGYRLDVPADEVDETPGEQLMRSLPHVENITTGMIPSAVSQCNEAVWQTAWGDGSEYPTLRDTLFLASEADDLGRAGIIATIAQARYGGCRNSSSKVQRVSDAGAREWRSLSAHLDEVRADLMPRETHACEIS